MSPSARPVPPAVARSKPSPKRTTSSASPTSSFPSSTSSRAASSTSSRRPTKNEVLSFLRGIQTTAVQEYVAEAIKEGFDLKGAYSKKEIKNAAVVAGRLQGDVRLSSKGIPYLPGALKDLSISRTTFDWGIPVPGNPKHVVYVWLDALANYITAIGYGSDDPAEQAKFARYWPADLHLVGKEITRFHCVYWPAFLLALNPKLKHGPNDPMPQLTPAEHAAWAKWLPKSIVANGWLLFEESKMSKSRGNIVRTETILDAFGEQVYAKQFPDSTKRERDLFAADVLRYFLLREIPFGQDGTFSFDALITRYNADLANGYGNLVSRTLTLTQTYFPDGFSNIHYWRFSSMIVADAIHTEFSDEWYVGESNDAGPQDQQQSSSLEQYVAHRFEAYDFSVALRELSFFIRQIDGFLSNREPWKLAKLHNKEAHAALEQTLYIAAEAIRIITALLYPVMPFATASVWRQLGLGEIEEAARNGELKNLKWGGLKPGTKLGPLAPIFPRADKGLAQIMTDMENPTHTHNPRTRDPSHTHSRSARGSTRRRRSNQQPTTNNKQLAANYNRRLRQGRSPRRPDRRRRAHPQGRQAPPPRSRSRPRLPPPPDPRRHRRVLPTRGPYRPQGGHRRKSRPAQDARPGIAGHGRRRIGRP